MLGCFSCLYLFCRHLELHSPDAKHTVVLRCLDSGSALAWFESMQSATNNLVNKVMPELSEAARNGIGASHEIRHLGWLAEKVRACNECVHRDVRYVKENSVLFIADRFILYSIILILCSGYAKHLATGESQQFNILL